MGHQDAIIAERIHANLLPESELRQLLLPLGCSIRLAAAADEPFLHALTAARCASEFRESGVDGQALRVLLDMQHRAQTAAYAAAFPDAANVIVVRGDEKVGRALINCAPGSLRIVVLELAPNAQRQGIGTAIIRALQHHAEATDVQLRLAVAQGCPAIALYRRLGFQTVSETGIRFEMEWRATEDRAAEQVSSN
jgi:ribosomal protein S18 acetylase RimI-like enzyme